MRASRQRLVLAGATALLVFWLIAIVVMVANRSNATGTGAAITQQPATPFRGGDLPSGVRDRPAPRFKLADARGGRLDTATLTGRPYVVTFLYTDCPDVCPLIASELKLALEQLGSRADEVMVLAVSADPDGDSRQAVVRWLDQRRMPPNFRYLTGTAAELRPVWRHYYAAPQPRGNPNSAHSASIWLVDRSGRWRTKFSGGVPVPPSDIAHDLRLLLDEADGQRAAR
jgi:protein SCO1